MFATIPIVIALALSPSPTGQEREPVVAGKLGLELDTYLENCTRFGFSGCALVQWKGKLLLRKGYGLARPYLGTPNTPETLYDIASSSKQVTAAAILLLESRGELSTDDSIADYLPGVPDEHREVTLYHLLTHTSGFPRGGPAGSGPDLEAAMKAYFQAERSGRAGQRFEYYNGGYAMLAGVVERVTGESFEDWVRDNLFAPAGLERTDFIETARVDQARLAGKRDSNGLTTDYIKGWGYKGMGGVLTSVSDLALWCNALFGGKVLPPKALEKMLTPNLEQYACGWYLLETDKGRKVVQHSGGASVFASYIRHFVEDELLVLVLTNREGWNWQVTWGLSSIVLNEDAKAPFPPEIAVLRAGELEKFCGTWEAGDERLFVRRSGTGLQVGGLGTEVVAALSPANPFRRPGNASASPPKASELAEAEQKALAILAELQRGSCELLGDEMLEHIPESWPERVLNRYWPEHLETWGAVRDQRSLGAFFDPATGRTRVWIRLTQARGERSVEVSFVGSKLNIFDLKAGDFPVELNVAPIDKGRLVGFDFQDQPPYELTLEGKGRARTLELKTRGGTKMTFRSRAR